VGNVSELKSRKLSCTVIVFEIAMDETIPISPTSKIISNENLVLSLRPIAPRYRHMFLIPIP